MQKRLALSFLMAGLISTSYTSSVQAFDWINKKNTLIAASLVLFPSVWQYISKKEVLIRYNLEELKAGKDILKNLLFLYCDGFWGGAPKNEIIKLKGVEGGEILYEKSPKRDGYGIIGTIHTNNKKILTSSAWVAALWALIHSDALFGIEIDYARILSFIKDPANAIKLFEKKHSA